MPVDAPVTSTLLTPRRSLRLLVVRALAALGRRQAPALGGNGTALHAVRRSDFDLDLLLRIDVAVLALLQLLENLLGHLVDLGRAHLLPHQPQLERDLLADADVR